MALYILMPSSYLAEMHTKRCMHSHLIRIFVSREEQRLTEKPGIRQPMD